MPFAATVTCDLSARPPSLTAVIPNAVLKAEIRSRSAVQPSGAQLMDGSYTFAGDYLREICPSGTQYLFDWTFSMSTNGGVVWNGITAWAGGHAWYVTISNITVALPHLSITEVGNASVRVVWSTNFNNYVLESAAALPAAGWSAVTNAVTAVR